MITAGALSLLGHFMQNRGLKNCSKSMSELEINSPNIVKGQDEKRYN
jgi:hypothetical protein